MGNWEVDKAMQTIVKYGFNDNDGNVLDYSRLILQSAVWLASDEQRELIDAAVDILCGEPCDDAISRHDIDKTELVSKKDVINLIDEWNAISFYEANEHSKECYYEIRNAVIAMQPLASCSDAISRQEAEK